jgi:hypothetical protein
MMNDEILLSQFEELADQLGILVRDENINLEESFSTGGLCRVEGKYISLEVRSHLSYFYNVIYLLIFYELTYDFLL